MKIRRTGTRLSDKVELQMTPMIDIVFQLIAFFVMSLKIATVEGDFNIKMPQASVAAGDADVVLPPIKVRLAANPDGKLAGLLLGERPMPSFAALNDEIRNLVGNQTGPGSLAESAEVELDCDYGLRYEHVIDAISAVSGFVSTDAQGQKQIVKLIEKIKFAQPRVDQ